MSSQPTQESEFFTEPQEVGSHALRESEATAIDLGNEAAEETKKRWDATVWTGEILNQHIVQSSRNELHASLSEFLREASEDDRKAYEKSRKKILAIMKEAKEKHDLKYPLQSPESERQFVNSVKAACKTASETAYEFAQILDVMVGQAPEYVALAYGAIKIILITHINYMNMKENVSDWMSKIRKNFEMIDHLTSYYPSKRLVDAIVRMFDAFQRFLAEVIKFYTRSRLKHALTSFKKPWAALEPIVKSIDITCVEIKDIVLLSTHLTGEVNLQISQTNLSTNRTVLATLNHMMIWMEANLVKFTDMNGIEETGGLLRQSVEAKMEQHYCDSTQKPEEDISAKDELRTGLSLDAHLSAIFADLVEFDETAAQQQKMTEQLPEMARHQQTQQSILRVDKVMDWLESKTSRLLWVDGGHVLNRLTFNASFVNPILILGNNTSETGCLILRHFCGVAYSARPSNYRTLLQALLRQLLKTREDVWKTLASEFTEDSACDIRKLWNLFVSCIKETQADCTFIIVDSIDCLVSKPLDSGLEEKDFVIRELNELVKESSPLVKILLTASLGEVHSLGSVPSARGPVSMALKAMSSSVIRQPRRSLSMNIFQGDLALAPQKLVEIQERRCTTVRFAEMALLYPVNSTIYTHEAGKLLAFVISEVSGMEPRSVGSYCTYEPLVLLVWAIDHKNDTFVKRHFKFKVRQFAGEMRIDQLQYIPSGFLIDEHIHRRQLIRRGRLYWEFSEKPCFMQCKVDGTIRRVVIDQKLRPSQQRALEDLDIPISRIHYRDLKPVFALVCPAQIFAYILHDNAWEQIDVLDIHMPIFKERHLSRFLGDTTTLRSAIDQFRDPDDMPSDPILVLLHGPPGVGKTTAARYSAEELKRPLLEISAGDVAKSEIVFRQILHQAKRWRAVLLLENMDLLFTEFGTSDIDYSQALRVKALEMHQGLVFLTTDRIGHLSDLMRHRITFPIELPYFDEGMRYQLWLQLLGDYGEWKVHPDVPEMLRLDELSGHSLDGLNGWGITNAFKNAVKLAESTRQKLSWDHLEQFLRAQLDIMRYMTKLYGRDEERRAKAIGYRARRADKKKNGVSLEEETVANKSPNSSDRSNPLNPPGPLYPPYPSSPWPVYPNMAPPALNYTPSQADSGTQGSSQPPQPSFYPYMYFLPNGKPPEALDIAESSLQSTQSQPAPARVAPATVDYNSTES